MAWGSNASPFILQTITQAIAESVEDRFRGIAVYVYLDDFGIFGHEKKTVARALRYLLKTLKLLHLTPNWEKSSTRPARRLDWLGFEVIMSNRSHNIALKWPNEKKERLKEQLKKFCAHPTFKNLLTFSGLANHAAIVHGGVRRYLSALDASLPAEVVADRSRHGEFIEVQPIRDYLWHIVGICTANTTLKYNLRGQTYEIAVDASDYGVGLASLDGKQVCSVPTHGKWWRRCGLEGHSVRSLHINVKEIYAVASAIHTAPQKCTLRIYCDNTSAIYAYANRSSKQRSAYPIIDAAYREAQRKRISFVLTYVRSAENPADDPSRYERNVIHGVRRIGEVN